jgi:hypothetical protein
MAQIALDPIDLDVGCENFISLFMSMGDLPGRNLRRCMPYPTNSLEDSQKALD